MRDHSSGEKEKKCRIIMKNLSLSCNDITHSCWPGHVIVSLSVSMSVHTCNTCALTLAPVSLFSWGSHYAFKFCFKSLTCLM